jgi:hypothetical protein
MDVLVPARGVIPMESSVFLRGKLYLSAYNFMVVAVDLEGNNLRYIRVLMLFIYRKDSCILHIKVTLNYQPGFLKVKIGP